MTNHSSPVTADMVLVQAMADYIYEETTKLDAPISMTACMVMSRSIVGRVARAQTQQEPVEAEIEAWIRSLDDEKDRNLVMWMERALRAEKELSEINGKLFANAQCAPDDKAFSLLNWGALELTSDMREQWRDEVVRYLTELSAVTSTECRNINDIISELPQDRQDKIAERTAELSSTDSGGK